MEHAWEIHHLKDEGLLAKVVQLTKVTCTRIHPRGTTWLPRMTPWNLHFFKGIDVEDVEPTVTVHLDLAKAHLYHYQVDHEQEMIGVGDMVGTIPSLKVTATMNQSGCVGAAMVSTTFNSYSMIDIVTRRHGAHQRSSCILSRWGTWCCHPSFCRPPYLPSRVASRPYIIKVEHALDVASHGFTILEEVLGLALVG